MRALLARKDVRLLLAGQTLSMFGDWMMIIVLAHLDEGLTGSSSAAGLVFFVFAIASLLAPLGGLVVDRLPKRRADDRTHVALAGVMCLLLFVHDRGDVWLLYVVTALYGLGGDLFAAARSAMMKAMVPDELLARCERRYQSIREGLRLVAPARGRGPLRRVRRADRRTRRRRHVRRSRLRRSSRCASASRPPRRRSTTSCASSPPASHTSRARRCSGSSASGSLPRCS